MRVFGLIINNRKGVLKVKTDANDIGKRIRALRKHEKLTQTEFGEKIGVKGNTVTGYENGTRRPSDSVINYICLVFQIDQTWLRTGEGGDDVVYLSNSSQQDELSQIRLKFNCNDLEMKFLTAYLGLKEKERDAFCELLKKMFPEALIAIAGKNPLARPWQDAPPLSETVETGEVPTTQDDVECLVQKGAEMIREQAISEEKPDAQASSVNGSAVG